MLRRKIAAELERWLKSAEQKALFITGSRQIGKSYSIRAFGKASHATYIFSRRGMPMISSAG